MFTYLGDLNLRRGQNVWVYYPFFFYSQHLVLANKFSIHTMGPTRYLILQQIPISSLLDPNPVIETTENSESNKEINLLPRDVRYEILHHFNLRDDEITPRDGYSRKNNDYVEINSCTGFHYDPLLDTYISGTSGYSKRMNMGLSHATLNKYGIGGKYSRSRFYDFSKHNNPKSKPEEKTAQEPIRVKMVDLLPSLTDTEEKLFDESNLLHLSTKKRKREDDTLVDIRDNTAIKLPPISTLPMPFPEH